MVKIPYLICILCLTFISNPAWACSCALDFKYNVETADVIFIGVAKGTVIEGGRYSMREERVTEFELFKIYKGWVSETVQVRSPNDTCAASFEPHKLQVVIARRNVDNLWMEHCDEGFSVMDYVNHFETPPSKFHDAVDLQRCFLQFQDAYERKQKGGDLYIADPDCKKFQSYNEGNFEIPQHED